MDNETKNIQQYDDFIENTPIEIRTFLWSDAFTILVKGVAKACKLTDEQTIALKDILFDIIIGYTGEAEVRNKLNEIKVPQATQEKLFALAYETIINPAVELAQDAYEIKANEIKEKPAEPETPEQTETPESIIKKDIVLENITQKIKQTAVIAPTKRDYSIESNKQTTAPAHTDPYREIPQ